ncbi:MAG TPA: hypothetical protein PL124_11300 [Candidatus Cloacimonadota bacterium]|nr:hypothetical protein [Candidatus Cloacimonadota bacterium]HPS39992.1 hypothetical protein [Candidatus Cloacimonadota bacterium]
MANDKTYDRHVNIWINGKEVTNNIASIKKEMLQLSNELAKTTRGTEEYNQKAAELRRVKGIIEEHNASLRKAPGLWEKIKGSMGLVMGAIGAAYGVIQSFKSIIESTDESSDKFARTMGGVKEAVNAVSQAMASGNFKNFFKNVRAAVEEGKRYADATDEAADAQRALALAEEDAADKILALKIIQADATKSREEQIAAGEKIEKIQADLAKKRAETAQITLDNEMENARFRSKLSDETIRAYLSKDEAMKKNMAIGKLYYEKTQEFSQLSTAEALARQGEYKKELESLGENAPEYARIYAGMSKITEDHRDRILAAEHAIREAKRSATEDILRQINKTNSARAAEADEAQKNAKKIIDLEKEVKEFYDKYDLWNVEAKAPGTPKYNPDEFTDVDKRIDADIEAQKKANEERVKNEKKAEQEIVDIYKKGADEGARIWKTNNENEIADLEQKVQAYQEFGMQIGQTLAQAMDDGVLTAKEAAKALISVALDALAKMAIVQIGNATVQSFGQYGAAAGAARTIILTALIEAAVESAKAALNNMWTGGYTGPGGKYEPRGIVHAGEWVANADMVASPVTGPIIRALEQYRSGGVKGYADGGYESQGSAGYGSKQNAFVFQTDQDQKEAINKMIILLDRLDREGVKTHFTYLDADRIKRGMDKLDNIRRSVSMRE